MVDGLRMDVRVLRLKLAMPVELKGGTEVYYALMKQLQMKPLRKQETKKHTYGR